MWEGRECHLFWMTRKPNDFLLGLDVLNRLQEKVLKARELYKDEPEKQPHVFVHLHVTGLSAQTEGAQLFQHAITNRSDMMLPRGSISANTLDNYAKPLDWIDLSELPCTREDNIPLTVLLGRPEWRQELNGVGIREGMVNIYVCGHMKLVEDLQGVSKELEQQNSARRFRVRYERFGA